MPAMDTPRPPALPPSHAAPPSVPVSAAAPVQLRLQPQAAPQFQPVLDYASPRARGKTRLPSRSTLVSEERPAGRDGAVAVTLTETLSGKGRAVFALVFAAITFVLLVLAVVQSVRSPVNRKLSLQKTPEAFVPLLLPGAVAAAEAVVMLLVVNNTWRRTVLTAEDDMLRLLFWSPLRTRRYAWEAAMIEDVRCVRGDGPTALHLAELQIHPAGSGVVHLFTDHVAGQVESAAAAVRRALRMPPVPGESEGTTDHGVLGYAGPGGALQGPNQ